MTISDLNLQSNNRTTVINNVHVVCEETIIPSGSIVIEDGRIAAIHHADSLPAHVTIDGQGSWLLPGFVDIHGDSLENAIAPRPAAPFPLHYILPAFDTELSVHGITTMYYCVAMADLGEKLTKPLRQRHQVLQVIEAINSFRVNARVRTRIHLRYEILDTEALPLINDLIQRKEVDLVSIMDHTPGYGVFKNVEAYRDYRRRSGGSLQEADEEIEQCFQLRERVDDEAIEQLIHSCHQLNIPTASHDDHTAEKVEKAAELGIGIAEFPVNIEAAAAACPLGMQTVFGAANLVRNQSHAGNVLAADMIDKGLCDIICSDYSPMAMLQGLFQIKGKTTMNLPDLVRLFSLNPAQAIGLADEIGSITPGKIADLILVQDTKPAPRVATTLIAGTPVYISNAVRCSSW